MSTGRAFRPCADAVAPEAHTMIRRLTATSTCQTISQGHIAQSQGGTLMDFGLFHTWNVLYDGGTVPWDPEYRGGKLLEEDAYAKNWEEMQPVGAMGGDDMRLG